MRRLKLFEGSAYTPGVLHGSRSHSPRSWGQGVSTLFVVAAVAAIAFVVLTADVWRTNAPVAVDRAAASFGIAAGEIGPLANHLRLAHTMERIGSPPAVGLGALALLVLALIWRDLVIALGGPAAPLASFVITEYIAKPLINQPIPYGGRMYPSGHTAGVAAILTTALVLVYRRRGLLVAAILAPLAAAVVVVVGLALLRLDFHHYVTDIVGGALLGASVSLTSVAVITVLTKGYPGPR